MFIGGRMSRGYLGDRWLRVLAIGSTAVLLVGLPVTAMTADGCLLHPAKLSDTVVQEFKGRSRGLLDDHPAGGVVMSSKVRRLAGTDVTTVPGLVSLASAANVPQVVALGVGLAGAANVCRTKRPDLAQKITDEVKNAKIPALFAAFAASLTSKQVAVMGGPEGLLPPGRAPDTSPLRAPEEPGAAKEDRPDDDANASRPSFGNGGIVLTVVKPVSPTR